MGVETALLAASVGSSLYGGYKKSKADAANQKQAQQAYKTNTGYITSAQQKSADPSAGETGLEAFLKSLGNGAGMNIPGLDNIQGIDKSTAYNSSQDALTQMVNRSAADYLGNAGTQLNDLATNGGKQDVSSLLAALGVQQGYATNEQAARLNAQSSGLGQLAGTAGRIGEARLRASLTRDNNVTNAGIQNAAMENAQNRRLAAAGQLGQLNLGAGQLNLGAAQGLTGLASLLSSNSLGLGQLALGRGQLAQGAAGQAISGYGMLGQLASQRNSQNNDLLRLLLGNQAPQQTGGTGLTDAAGDAANSLILLRRLGKK